MLIGNQDKSPIKLKVCDKQILINSCFRELIIKNVSNKVAKRGQGHCSIIKLGNITLKNRF